LITAVVAPVFQLYVVAPAAVRVADTLLHTVGDVELSVTPGAAEYTMLIVAAAEQTPLVPVRV
jgi:hypothetical protein